MGKRRKGREVALQFLYQLDLHGAGDPAPHEDEFWGRHPVDPDTRSFADSLVRGTKQHQGKTDQLITQYAEHWDLDRMAVVDRNILRLAVHELLWQPDVPPKVAINEAIEHRQEIRYGRIEPLHQRPPGSDPERASTGLRVRRAALQYAILSDIHANLEALRAVLADAADKADAVLCLGDTVGYGADPLACVELIAERSEAIVAGNHEHAVADRLDLSWFNRYARAAAEWTRERLDSAHRDWLGALPLVREIGDATLVHASPAQPDDWDYLVTAEDGFAAFPTSRPAGVSWGTRTCRGCGRWARRDPTTSAVGPRCAASKAGATSSTWAASASRGTAIRARPRPCGTWRRGGSSCGGSPTTSHAARRKIVEAGLPQFLADRLAAGA